MRYVIQLVLLWFCSFFVPANIRAEVSICTSSHASSLQMKKGSKCQSGSKRLFVLPEASDVVGSFSGRKKPAYYVKSEEVSIDPIGEDTLNDVTSGIAQTFNILCNPGDLAIAGGFQFPTTADHRIKAGGSSIGAEIATSMPLIQSGDEPQGWTLQILNVRTGPSTVIISVSCQIISK